MEHLRLGRQRSRALRCRHLVFICLSILIDPIRQADAQVASPEVKAPDASAPAAKAQAPEVKAPDASKLKFSGEIVARIMYVVNENFAATNDAGQPKYNDDIWSVMRFRLRLGAEYRATDTVTMGLRLSSGDPSYPSSSFQFPLNDFRKFAISIDRAYVFWQPRGFLQLRFGIQQNPLFTPTEILWDADVHPIGTAQVIAFGNTGLTLSAGQFWLREVRSTKDNEPNTQNSFLFMEQLAYAIPLSFAKTTIAVASYHFTNPNTAARSVQTGEFSGDFKTNRFNPNGATIADPKDAAKQLPVDYFSGFSLLNVGLKAELAAIPLTIAADLVINLKARRDASLGAAYKHRKNLAVGVMVRYGRNQKTHDWMVGAGFFHIEADSALAVYNNDEIQQTNVNSIPVEFTYTIYKDVRATLDAYIAKKEDVALPTFGGFVSDQNAWRIRSNLRLAASF
jgi:hypothetical protein